MKLRKISSRYIYTSKGEVLENGIVIVNNEGIIVDLINTNGCILEEEGLEYYSGIICPGFIISCKNLLLNDAKEARQLDLFLFKRGIVSVGDFSFKNNIKYYNDGNKVIYQDVSSIFESSTFTQNEIVKHNSEGENIYCLGFSSNYSVNSFSLKSILSDLLESGIINSFNDIVELLCVKGAKYLGIEESYGTIEKGKKPGLNLISGLNLSNIKSTSDLLLKKLL